MNPLEYQSLTLSVKYISVLFPFDSLRFLKALLKQGYLKPEGDIPQAPFGGRIEVNGVIGRKGDISIRVDSRKNIVGVQAQDPETVLSEMETIEALLSKAFDFDSAGSAHYYEFLVTAYIKAEENPLDIWASHSEQTPLMDEFSQVLGMDVYPFGVKLSCRGETPMGPNWLEFRINPLVQAVTTYHQVETIFRNSDRDAVFRFIQKFDQYTHELLSKIEKR